VHVNPSTINPHLNQPMGELFRQTMNREGVLTRMGYSIKRVWECEFDQRRKNDLVFAAACTQFSPRMRLNPHDGLYGGRTGANRLAYHCGEGERILYLDVVSGESCAWSPLSIAGLSTGVLCVQSTRS
jgi:hypothetical protein